METIQPGRVTRSVDGLVAVEVGTAQLLAVAPDLPPGTKDVHVCIRADNVILLKGKSTPATSRNQLTATVRGINPEGTLMRLELDCGFPLAALLTRQACEELSLKPGDAVVALIKAPNVHLIPR
jgi:molybdate transport system ATP-binding protein